MLTGVDFLSLLGIVSRNVNGLALNGGRMAISRMQCLRVMKRSVPNTIITKFGIQLDFVKASHSGSRPHWAKQTLVI